MIGVQFPSAALVGRLVEAALRRGLILLPAGDGDVIELVPPLTVSDTEIALCRKILEESLAVAKNSNLMPA
jgi:4-aminobutyrate aminotransferase-like enzyme